TYLLNGGTIKGGTWTIGGTGTMKFGSSSNNALDGVTVASNSGLDLSASSSYVRLLNGTSFAPNTAITVGSNGGLGIAQSQTVDNLAITLGGNSSLAVEGTSTATLGANFTVAQAASTSGNVGASFKFSGTGNLVNQGTIQVVNTNATSTVN